MLFRNLLIILLSMSFTILSAQTFEIKPYEISTEQNLQTTKQDQELKTGMAVDIKTDEESNFNYRVAYEGDYMFMNDYLEEEKQIKNNNIYIGIGYKF